ncbi:hypothetical protein HanIR_Chr11g0546551 [Helianthus annuus]|nr:hypothetical protein HanIR_Chr11g0546551 [Helianthus annuus]
MCRRKTCMCGSSRGFPVCGLRGSAFTMGQFTVKAVSGKMTKHEKACLDNQHVFISFAFDTFGHA